MNINVQQFHLNHRPTGPSYAFETRVIGASFERVVSTVGAIAPRFALVCAPPAEGVPGLDGADFVAHALQTRADGRCVTVVLLVRRHSNGAALTFGSYSHDPPQPASAPVPVSPARFVYAINACLVVLSIAWGSRVSVGWWLLIVVACVVSFVVFTLPVLPAVPAVEPYNPLLAVLDENSDERRFARALLAALEERLSR